jgi:hypothetical protein
MPITITNQQTKQVTTKKDETGNEAGQLLFSLFNLGDSKNVLLRQAVETSTPESDMMQLMHTPSSSY